MRAEARPQRPFTQIVWVMTAIAIALGVAFQIQATPKFGGNQMRLSVADLVSPIIFLGLVIISVRQRLSWPRWSMPHLWLWLGLLSAVMSMALIVGRVKFGYWLPWAAVNKFGGWFALVWYLALGGLVAATIGARGKERFLQAFLVFLWMACAVSLLGYLLYQANASLPSWMRYNRAEGFVQNPNAFGLFIAVGIAAQLPYAKRNALFNVWVHRSGLAMALTALVLTGSRSAWIGALFAALLLAGVRMMPWRHIGVATLLAGALLAALLFGTPEIFDPRPGNYQNVTGGYVLNEPMFSGDDRGLSYRYRTGVAALRLWLVEPILGAGLGGFPQYLIKAGHVPEVIHNTYLWILTEMGAVGFAVFAAFFVVLLRRLRQRHHDSEDPKIAIAALAVLLAVAGAAIGMEAMYQRHVWFLLGLALAAPRMVDRVRASGDLR